VHFLRLSSGRRCVRCGTTLTRLQRLYHTHTRYYNAPPSHVFPVRSIFALWLGDYYTGCYLFILYAFSVGCLARYGTGSALVLPVVWILTYLSFADYMNVWVWKKCK
jgi:hypothetical protein